MPVKLSQSANATGRIYTQLRRRLKNGEFKPGVRLPSLRKLADSYDSSKATMQTVLETLKHDGLVVAEHGRGFYASGKTTRMRRMLLLNPTTGHEWADYTQAFIAACSQTSDLSLLVEDAGFDRQQLAERVTAHLVEGVETIVFNGLSDFQLAFVSQFAGRAELVCFYSGDAIRNKVDCPLVSPDWFRGGEMAIEHLASRKCRDVLIISHPNSGGDLHQIDCGAQAAASALGINLFGLSLDVKDEQAAAKLKAKLKSNPDITGIFATADYRIVPHLASMRAWGYDVPGDLKVVGYFNTPWSKVCEPALTSISTQPAEIAQRAISLLQHHEQSGCILVEPELIERASTSR